MTDHALIPMRVAEGKADLPYNDGEGPKLHRPGEVFEGSPVLLREFPGWLEPLDAQGEPVQSFAERDPRLLTARAHEQAGYLTELKARRAEEHAAELAALDAQIAKATAQAEEEARAKQATQNATQDAQAAAGATNAGGADPQAPAGGERAARPVRGSGKAAADLTNE